MIAPSLANITRSTLQRNVAHGGPGNPGGDGFGGGAYNDDTSAVTLRRSIVVDNSALGAQVGGIGVGGGIYDLGTLDFDTFSIIRRNHASTSHDNIFDD